ncbi:MAG TPA: hypothetical protein VHM02_04645, partial [Thermoanaerobaculia bacterium]|nr:hypothetical protein [Thermoanaerobaculia bacterium]
MSDEPAAEREVEPPQHEVAPADRRLMAAAALPALAWLTQLLFGLATVRWMCRIESRLPLALATAVALAAALWALVACRRALARARRPGAGEPLAGA